MKRALLVGIDYYEDGPWLAGCANDAEALHPLLGRHENGDPNFECRLATARDAASSLTRDLLLAMVDDLLSTGRANLALLYFAGHGALVNGGVALATSDATPHTPGVMFSEILAKINASGISDIVVILDCCFSGGAATIEALNNGLANLRTGLAVLTASRDDQYSIETEEGRGQFSTYLEGALHGGAADVLGNVNVAGLYAYLSESFGAWDQRPTFKANIDLLHDIRKCGPRIRLGSLRQLTELFPTQDYDYPLSPSYEPTANAQRDPDEEIFRLLEDYKAYRLVEPIGYDHMYFAAINSTGCRLTPLGKHYWHMAKDNRI